MVMLREQSSKHTANFGVNERSPISVMLRVVPTLTTAHKFCASRDGLSNSGFLTVVPARTTIFLRGS